MSREPDLILRARMILVGVSAVFVRALRRESWGVRDAIVAVVDYRILEKCVEATVDIDPVRVSSEVWRVEIHTGHPRLYVFIQSQEPRRCIFHGQ